MANPITKAALARVIPHIQVEEINFEKTSSDVYGDGFQSVYPTPHWKRGRSIISPPLYIRDTPLKLSAKFTVADFPAGEKVWASAFIYADYFFGTLPAQDITGGSYSTATAEIYNGSGTNLPNLMMARRMFVAWSYGVGPDKDHISYGNGAETILFPKFYIALDGSNTKLYHTVVDVGCRNGEGLIRQSFATDDDYKIAAFNAIWSDFADPVPGVMAAYPLDVPDYGSQVTEMKYWPLGYDTPEIFDTSPLVLNRAGRCGAWTRFMRDVLAGQRISADVYRIVPKDAVGPAPSGYPNLVSNGFDVNSNHPGQGNSGPALYGEPGEPVNGLPCRFTDHALVNVTGVPAPSQGEDFIKSTIYDPSYGLSF